MNMYIAILRGINVGGNRKLPMADLRSIMDNLGFKKVKTYIQSGNIIFESDISDIKKIEDTISQSILSNFNYNVPTIVKTIEDWEQAIVNNPYKGKDIKQVLFTFLKEVPQIKLQNYSSENDEYQLIHDVVHLHCPNGYGKTKLNNNYFEKELGIIATTRNWNTVEKLLQLAKNNI